MAPRHDQAPISPTARQAFGIRCQFTKMPDAFLSTRQANNIQAPSITISELLIYGRCVAAAILQYRSGLTRRALINRAHVSGAILHYTCIVRRAAAARARLFNTRRIARAILRDPRETVARSRALADVAVIPIPGLTYDGPCAVGILKGRAVIARACLLYISTRTAVRLCRRSDVSNAGLLDINVIVSADIVAVFLIGRCNIPCPGLNNINVIIERNAALIDFSNVGGAVLLDICVVSGLRHGDASHNESCSHRTK